MIQMLLFLQLGTFAQVSTESMRPNTDPLIDISGNLHRLQRQVLTFEYDDSGNITTRYYKNEDVQLDSIIVPINNFVEAGDAKYKIRLSPSPTKGPVSLNVNNYMSTDRGICVFVNSNNVNYKMFTFQGPSNIFDISSLPSGITVVRVVLDISTKNSREYTLKIIKK